MKNEEFIDYYEVLEASSNANSETIERVFRYLAHRLHPDTSDNNSHDRFNKLVEAYDVLKDPKSRAVYDIEYRKHQQHKADLMNGAEKTGSDTVDRHRMLSLFYAKRRREMDNPGVGVMTLEQILGIPEEVLEFHLWYFREKGWVSREENGMLAITAEGVDQIEAANQSWATSNRLITDQSSGNHKTATTANGSKISKKTGRPELALN